MLRSHSVALVALVLCTGALAQTIPHHPRSPEAPAASIGKVDPELVLIDRISSFCHSHLGQTVGSGECCDLAQEALAWAGGQPRLPDSSNDDYVWGNLICKLENKQTEFGPVRRKPDGRADIRPGDIIQLRNIKFYHQDPGGYYNYHEYPHHTAVVEEVSEDDNYCKVYEQNANGKRFVIETTYTMFEITSGWMRFYRPIPRA